MSGRQQPTKRRPDDFDVAYRRLEAAAGRWCIGMPQTVEQAHALLVEEFAELGVTATFNTATGTVVFPRSRRR